MKRSPAALRSRAPSPRSASDSRNLGWPATFNAVGVPHARINDYASALADPQVAHMEWLQSIALPGGHMTQTFASPLRLNGQGFPIHLNPPALGEHTDDVLTRVLGYDAARLAALKESGALG